MTKKQFEEISKRKYAEDRIVYIVFEGDEKATALHIVYDNEWLLARKHLKDLYETKEDAEWAHEFGNIQWIERLELPTWDKIWYEMDISDGDNVIFTFNAKDGTKCTLSVIDMGDDDFSDWTMVLEKQGKEIYYFDYTRDGYLEACRLCKKLFLEGK